MHDLPLIAVTMGDPAGIGPEICAKALTAQEVQVIANCLVIGERKAMRQGLKIAKIPNIEINPIKKISEAKFIRGSIDVLDLKNVDKRLKTGQVSRNAGKASVEYVEKATRLAQDGKIDAITTAPINKEAIRKAGYKFQGHTELLATRTKASSSASSSSGLPDLKAASGNDQASSREECCRVQSLESSNLTRSCTSSPARCRT